MSVNGTITGTFNANDIRTVGLNSGANIPVNSTAATAFTNGTGALGVQVLYQTVQTFSGTTVTIDLFSGATDSYGTSMVLTAVKAIQIINTGLNQIAIGNAGSNAWTSFITGTGTIILPPGGWLVAATPDATGWVVGTSTDVNLLFTGTSGQTFTFALLGNGT